jgi:hypothetical protein
MIFRPLRLKVEWSGVRYEPEQRLKDLFPTPHCSEFDTARVYLPGLFPSGVCFSNQYGNRNGERNVVSL